jgi:hypothetical protein
MAIRLAIVMVLVCAISGGMDVTPKPINVIFGGGYAFVWSKSSKQLEVGTIRKPHWYSTDYRLHRMKLYVTNGTIEPTTTVPTESIGSGNDIKLGWDITDRVVTIDGQATSGVELPPYTPDDDCKDGTESNNRYFLPEPQKLAGQTDLATDWEKRLRGHLSLKSGTLKVTSLAGCFALYEGETEKSRRFFANGMDGIKYSSTFTDGSITFRVVDDKAHDVGIIVIAPKNGSVTVSISTEEMAGTIQGPLRIKHFKHFYWLLDKDVDKQIIPVWLGDDKARALAKLQGYGEATPGEACPPGLYEIP